MSQIQRILLFVILPILAPLLVPPEWFSNAGFRLFISIVIVLGIVAAVFTMRRSAGGITLTIFVQGLNVISRLMMFWPHFTDAGRIDIFYVLTSVVSLALSAYLVLRLDKVDVRIQMVR